MTTATATPKRTRKAKGEQTATDTPPAAPQTEATADEVRPAPRRTDPTSTVTPRAGRWWTAAPSHRAPGEGNVPARTIPPGFSHSHCVHCGAVGPDHRQGDRECILRKRASRAIVPHAAGRDGLKKSNCIFRRWLIWAYGIEYANKHLRARD